MNRRGFSLVEMISVTVLTVTLGLVSSKWYGFSQVKSRQLEAKTQLGLLHQGEQGWLLEHGTYTSHINLILFPKGKIRYNVGFHSEKQDFSYCRDCSTLCSGCPTDCRDCPTDCHRNPKRRYPYPKYTSNRSHINNSWELCGEGFSYSGTDNFPRKECALQYDNGEPLCTLRSQPSCPAFLYPTKWTEMNWPGTDINALNGNPSSCEKEGNKDTYNKFFAYAIGDITYKSKATNDMNKMDIWVINEYGDLENCYDGALDSSQTFTTQCDRN